MTSLSPAARAIVDAFNDRYELCGPLEDNWHEVSLAAALRAAADQLTVTNGECPGVTLWEQGFLAGASGAQQGLHNLAAELEGG